MIAQSYSRPQNITPPVFTVDDLALPETGKTNQAITGLASKLASTSPTKCVTTSTTISTTTAALNSLLASFAGYGLTDLNKANLMNRVDSKFIIPISFLPDLLAQLKNDYRVLDINNQRCFSYSNQYYDTPKLDFYHAHHNGKLNRFKVRRRRYVDTDTEFLEVKLKNNKKRTIKTRIKLIDSPDQYIDCINFIQEQLNEPAFNLDVTQQSGYRRIALANEENAERLTLDFDLWYKNRQGNNEVQLPQFFIAELKQNKKSKRSPFYQLMSNNNIFPTSFSKYCIGCALLYRSSIKSNRFKSMLSQLDKLNQSSQPLSLKSN